MRYQFGIDKDPFDETCRCWLSSMAERPQGEDLTRTKFDIPPSMPNEIAPLQVIILRDVPPVDPPVPPIELVFLNRQQWWTQYPPKQAVRDASKDPDYEFPPGMPDDGRPWVLTTLWAGSSEEIATMFTQRMEMSDALGSRWSNWFY